MCVCVCQINLKMQTIKIYKNILVQIGFQWAWRSWCIIKKRLADLAMAKWLNPQKLEAIQPRI